MKKSVFVIALSMVVTVSSVAPVAGAQKKEGGERPLIQVAILLDNSGSMSGLINQARTQLWKIVNQFATTEKDGRTPRLQVGLYTYGTPPPKQLTALTTDLDGVSEKLFAVKISGGSEHCGQVIQTAVKELDWSDRNDVLKVIFIAGNEAFTQGPVDYAKACKKAISNGVIVNTIHCGPKQAGISGKWKDGAMLADGSFSCINQNRAVTHIEAPQDEKIAKLSKKLNKTYIAYGEKGGAFKKRQAKQDANAAENASAGAHVQRAVTKANAQYVNADWDLVDAVENDKVELKDVEKKALPEKMRDMSMKERKAYVKKNAQKRKNVEKKIRKLNADRKKYIAKKRRKESESGKETLGEALSDALLKQAAEKGFNKGGQENE